MPDIINSRDQLETVFNTELSNLKTFINGWCDRLFSIVKERLPYDDFDVNMADIPQNHSGAFTGFPGTDSNVTNRNNNLTYGRQICRNAPRPACTPYSETKHHRLIKGGVTTAKRYRNSSHRKWTNHSGVNKGPLPNTPIIESAIATPKSNSSHRVDGSKVVTEDQVTVENCITTPQPRATTSAITTRMSPDVTAGSMVHNNSVLSPAGTDIGYKGTGDMSSLCITGQKPLTTLYNYSIPSTSTFEQYQPSDQSHIDNAPPPAPDTGAMSMEKPGVALDEPSIKTEPWSEDSQSALATQSECHSASTGNDLLYSSAPGPSNNDGSKFSTLPLSGSFLSADEPCSSLHYVLNEEDATAMPTISNIRGIINNNGHPSGISGHHYPVPSVGIANLAPGAASPQVKQDHHQPQGGAKSSLHHQSGNRPTLYPSHDSIQFVVPPQDNMYPGLTFRDLNAMQKAALTRFNFAKRLARKLFTKEERYDRNCSGKCGKDRLDPEKLGHIKQLAMAWFPLESCELEEVAWAQCIRKIDEDGRQISRLARRPVCTLYSETKRHRLIKGGVSAKRYRNGSLRKWTNYTGVNKRSSPNIAIRESAITTTGSNESIRVNRSKVVRDEHTTIQNCITAPQPRATTSAITAPMSQVVTGSMVNDNFSAPANTDMELMGSEDMSSLSTIGQRQLTTQYNYSIPSTSTFEHQRSDQSHIDNALPLESGTGASSTISMVEPSIKTEPRSVDSQSAVATQSEYHSASTSNDVPYSSGSGASNNGSKFSTLPLSGSFLSADEPCSSLHYVLNEEDATAMPTISGQSLQPLGILVERRYWTYIPLLLPGQDYCCRRFR